MVASLWGFIKVCRFDIGRNKERVQFTQHSNDKRKDWNCRMILAEKMNSQNIGKELEIETKNSDWIIDRFKLHDVEVDEDKCFGFAER